jgi:hypothetical protein
VCVCVCACVTNRGQCVRTERAGLCARTFAHRGGGCSCDPAQHLTPSEWTHIAVAYSLRTQELRVTAPRAPDCGIVPRGYGYPRCTAGFVGVRRELQGGERYVRVLNGGGGYVRVLTGSEGYVRVLWEAWRVARKPSLRLSSRTVVLYGCVRTCARACMRRACARACSCACMRACMRKCESIRPQLWPGKERRNHSSARGVVYE